MNYKNEFENTFSTVSETARTISNFVKKKRNRKESQTYNLYYIESRNVQKRETSRLILIKTCLFRIIEYC